MPRISSQNLGQPAVTSSLEAERSLVPFEAIIHKAERLIKCQDMLTKPTSAACANIEWLRDRSAQWVLRPNSVMLWRLPDALWLSLTIKRGWGSSPPDSVAGTAVPRHCKHAINVSCCCFLRCCPDFYENQQPIETVLNPSIFILMESGKWAPT